MKKAELDRFWSKVAIGMDDECWPWTGAKLPKGYGRVKINGRAELAHRVAFFGQNWSHAVRRAPEPIILHACDNPSCCNPKHLSLGTYRQNYADSVVRERRAPRDWRIQARSDGTWDVLRGDTKVCTTLKYRHARLIRSSLEAATRGKDVDLDHGDAHDNLFDVADLATETAA